MPQKLRILVSAVPHGPWAGLADALTAAGAEVLSIPHDAAAIEPPAGWIPDGLVTLPAEHQRARFDQIDLDRWDAVARQELDQRFRIGQAAARTMLERDGGAIVHLVADEGLPGAAGQGSAASLSYAVAGLSRGIALDLKDKVRSNVVAVQWDVEAAAALILYLCGPQGRAVSGQMISVSAMDLQLFSQSRPLRVAHRDGGWDEASLADQVRRWSAYLPRIDEAGALK